MASRPRNSEVLMKFAYFLSCINESITKEVNCSLDLLNSTLGITMIRLENGTCCGGSNLDYVSPDHFLAINGRNIALAEQLGLDLVTSCNTCLLTLRRAKQALDASQNKRDMVNKLLESEGLTYRGTSEIKHILWVISEDFGLSRLSERVVRPLAGIRFAPFYGCHIIRPSHLLGRDDPAAPASLDRVIEALGGVPVEYPAKSGCCGFHTLLVAEKESLALSGDAVEAASRADADYIVTPCPLCHTALDAYQSQALHGRTINRKMPVLHLSQMIGLAFGYSIDELGIGRHIVT